MSRLRGKSGTYCHNGGDHDINDRLEDHLLANDDMAYVDGINSSAQVTHPTRNTVKITYSVDALCQDLP